MIYENTDTFFTLSDSLACNNPLLVAVKPFRSLPSTYLSTKTNRSLIRDCSWLESSDSKHSSNE